MGSLHATPVPGKGLTIRIGPQWVDQALILRSQVSGALGTEVSLTVVLKAAVLRLACRPRIQREVAEECQRILSTPVTRAKRTPQPDKVRWQTMYASRETIAILDRLQAEYHPEMSKAEILHKALDLYNSGTPEYRAQYVPPRPGERAAKVPRANKRPVVIRKKV